MNDPNVITGEEILREGLMLDERLYEYGDGPAVVEDDKTAGVGGTRRDGRRRRSTGELLEALGYAPGDAARRAQPLGDDEEQAWEDAWQREFGAAAEAERTRVEVSRAGVAEALRDRAPRRRRRYTPEQARAFLRGTA